MTSKKSVFIILKKSLTNFTNMMLLIIIKLLTFTLTKVKLHERCKRIIEHEILRIYWFYLVRLN